MENLKQIPEQASDYIQKWVGKYKGIKWEILFTTNDGMQKDTPPGRSAKRWSTSWLTKTKQWSWCWNPKSPNAMAKQWG